MIQRLYKKAHTKTPKKWLRRTNYFEERENLCQLTQINCGMLHANVPLSIE